MPIALNNLNGRIRTETVRNIQILLQNAWHEVEYRLMCAGKQIEQILNFTRYEKETS